MTQPISDAEIQRFERSMSDKFGRQVAISGIPLKNFVDVDSGLLEKKVNSLIMQGATDEAGYWRDIARVYTMTTPIEVVGLHSMRDYKVRTGKMSRAALEEAGGKIDSVTLDVSNDEKIRYLYLEIDENDLRLGKINSIEDAIKTAGSAFAKHVRDDIISAYLTHKGADVEQALSTDKRYAALFKLAAKMNKKGFGMNCIIVDADDLVQAITEETDNGHLAWLTAMQAGASFGNNFASSIGNLNGHIGMFGAKVPIYVVGDTSASLNGTILGVDKDKGIAVGLYEDMRFAKNVNTMKDLVEAKIQARYDIEKANANAIGWVSGA
ncbi:hypothetical protein [Candidatus Nitrososphaera sp. FF02]|uniref:hypothetical protein n=1 Tax=Candidatus Nitrososphaera sp. FF02 TaxID=3398226 RepID=UPI0039E80803